MDETALKRLAGKLNVPLGIVEKDYVLTIVLHWISSSHYVGKMAFKGGTCIKKVYFPEARFSVDLDFSCISDVINQGLLDSLNETFRNKELYGIRFIGATVEEQRPNAVRISLKHLDMRGHPTSIKLDLSLREKVSLTPSFRPVLGTYELPPFRIKALKLEEILAEKVRAVIARGSPRDVYDVWFLLKKGVPFNLTLVNEKLQLLKYDRVFSLDLFMKRMEDQRNVWQRDLEMLLAKVPSFDTVRAEVLERLQKALI